MPKETKPGVVMTPRPIVKMILDKAGYYGEKILNQKIMEPSFGDGAFLCEIVERILDVCKQKHILDMRPYLDNVYGFEIDRKLYDKAIKNVNAVAAKYGVYGVDMKHLVCGDAVELSAEYKNKFDYVVGNPPYICNGSIGKKLKEQMKSMQFTGGVSDAYVAFMEIGLGMMKADGVLSMITPNSYLKNASQQKFRDYLCENGYVRAIYDFKSDKVFDAGTYCCVSVLCKTSHTRLQQCSYNNGGIRFCKAVKITSKEFKEHFEGKTWNVISKSDMKFLQKIHDKDVKFTDIANIQNGITTNAMDIYTINPFYDKELTKPYGEKDGAGSVFFRSYSGEVVEIERGILRRAVKSTRYEGGTISTYLIFPYDENGKTYDEDTLKERFPLGYAYLLKNKEKLMERDMEKNSVWYAYARSQGIRNSNRKKVVFKQALKKDTKNIDAYVLDEDVLVYNGAFVTAEDEKKLERIRRIIESEMFAKYCTMTCKDIANGYVSIGTKQVKEYRFAERNT